LKWSNKGLTITWNLELVQTRYKMNGNLTYYFTISLSAMLLLF